MLADSLKRSSEFTVRLNLAQTGRAEMCSGCRERLPRLSLRSAAASAYVLCQGNSGFGDLSMYIHPHRCSLLQRGGSEV